MNQPTVTSYEDKATFYFVIFNLYVYLYEIIILI